VDSDSQMGRPPARYGELFRKFHVDTCAAPVSHSRRYPTRRRAEEAVDLLGDSVHVDAERGAAVTDEPQAQLLGSAGHSEPEPDQKNHGVLRHGLTSFAQTSRTGRHERDAALTCRCANGI